MNDMLAAKTDDLKQFMMEHHFEMIKQFFLMQVNT